MTERPLAVVLLSGGMDSCVTTAIASRTHRLALLHAGYGQRTEWRERRAFENIAEFYAVPPERRLRARLEYFAQIGGSALTDRRMEIPERENQSQKAQMLRKNPSGSLSHKVERDEIPPTYVPFRNAHFLSIAVSWAEVIGASSVFIGAVEEDSSGYPDCRPEYFRLFSELVKAGTRPETQIEIVTPVIAMRKGEIVKRGIELGAPLHLTWSCYQDEEDACGVCDSCRLRLRGFAEAGVPDPIAYRAAVAR